MNGVTLPGAGPSLVRLGYQRLAAKLITIIKDKDEGRGEDPLLSDEVSKPDNVQNPRTKKKQ